MRSIAPRLTSLPLGRLVRLGLASSLVGCGSVAPVAPAADPITDPAQLYVRLTLDHPAVTLDTAAGYNTLQLTATPHDALGNPMVGLPTPTFRSTDTSRVRVTAEGLITGIQAAEVNSPVNVIAELTAGSIRHADTAVVVVTTLASPPQLASVSLKPAESDSAIWTTHGVDGFVIFLLSFAGYSTSPPTLTASAIAETGDTIQGLPFEYTSLDPDIATVGRRTGTPQMIGPGKVRMVARTTMYGVAKADTVTFTVTMPTTYSIAIQPSASGALVFVPSEIQVRSDAIVSWQTQELKAADVTFDDPSSVISPPSDLCDVLNMFLAFGFFTPGSSCGVGDALVPAAQMRDVNGQLFPTISMQLRQFSEPGVYTYHSTLIGATGRVIVTAP